MYNIVFKACLYSKYKLNLNFLWSAQRDDNNFSDLMDTVNTSACNLQTACNPLLLLLAAVAGK